MCIGSTTPTATPSYPVEDSSGQNTAPGLGPIGVFVNGVAIFTAEDGMYDSKNATLPEMSRALSGLMTLYSGATRP